MTACKKIALIPRPYFTAEDKVPSSINHSSLITSRGRKVTSTRGPKTTGWGLRRGPAAGAGLLAVERAGCSALPAGPPGGAGRQREGGSRCGRRRPERGAARPYPRSTSCCPRLRTRPAAALPAPFSRCATAGKVPPAPAAGRDGGGFCCPAAPCAQSARHPSHTKQGCSQSHRRLPIVRLTRWDTAEAAGWGPGRGVPVPHGRQRARLPSSPGAGCSRGKSFFSPPQPALQPEASAGHDDTKVGSTLHPLPLSPEREGGEKSGKEVELVRIFFPLGKRKLDLGKNKNKMLMNSKSVRKNVPRWTDWRTKPPTKPKGRFYRWLAVRERPGGSGPASRPVLRPPGGGGERLRGEGCGSAASDTSTPGGAERAGLRVVDRVAPPPPPPHTRG